MTARRLAAVDAQTFWMSARVPNDQFLLYAFAGVPDRRDEVLAALRDRAMACPDLRLRIADDHPLRYPTWVDAVVNPEQIIAYEAPDLDWVGCLDAVAALAADQLDPTRAGWRLHVFAPVAGVPGAAPGGPATVAVLQIPHALADGTRTADLAAWLFGRAAPVAPVAAVGRGNPVLRGLAAARAHRRLVRDIAAGRLSAPGEPRPALLSNAAPGGPRRVRTLVRRRSELAGQATVTVAVLVAVASALAGYIADRGEDPARLAAEVPMVKPGIRHAHNHFRNVGIDLHPELRPAERTAAIAAELRAARARGEHPALLAGDRSFAAVPAALLRWGVGQFDPAVRPPAVTGNTVVSSVNRGPADLHFGAAPVILTAGYPALSPMMGLTHGVHGIGDTVAVSVHTADSVVDIDDYLARLALGVDRGWSAT